MPTTRQIEAVARVIMAADGFEFQGRSLIEEAGRGNPRPAKWVKLAKEILKTVEKMRRKKKRARPAPPLMMPFQ